MHLTCRVHLFISTGFVLSLLGMRAVDCAAQCPAYATPTSIQFGNQTVGTVSSGRGVQITSTSSTSVTISFTLSPLEFHVVDGYGPIIFQPGQYKGFVFNFAPDVAQSFNGQLVYNITDSKGLNCNVVVPFSGTGVNTGAGASLSAPALTFLNQPVGTTSAAQTVTLTNSGTSAFNVTAVNADPPFAVTGFTKTTTLGPGASLPLQVTFFGAAPGSYNGELTMLYDVLPAGGVTLSGSATTAAALAISTFPTLPPATQNFSYLATLLAWGGTAPYTWGLASGSALPAGLSLSSSGTLSGTVTSGLGTFPFAVLVTDSSWPPLTASANMTLQVDKTNGAICNNIVFNVASSTSPIIPLTDLGTGAYLGSEGGLYPNGSNVRPPDHDAAGVSLAESIQPLDGNGNFDANGKYVLLSIGISNTQTEFLQFISDANADPSKNPKLVIVNGAQPGGSAAYFANPNSAYWNAIMNYYLPQAGVTANQVVAAWVLAVDGITSGSFPGDMAGLQSELESIAQNLHSKFPNLKLAYFFSRDYAGYSNGEPHPGNPEPYAYETGFAVKWGIQDQLDGNPSLNFDPSKGPVMAPWMSWADYPWANGLLARSDGLVWSCQDFVRDGSHPTQPMGAEKAANLILNFFKTDDTAASWFLAAQSMSRGK